MITCFCHESQICRLLNRFFRSWFATNGALTSLVSIIAQLIFDTPRQAHPPLPAMFRRTLPSFFATNEIPKPNQKVTITSAFTHSERFRIPRNFQVSPHSRLVTHVRQHESELARVCDWLRRPVTILCNFRKPPLQGALPKKT
jgi:hypothetical protein